MITATVARSTATQIIACHVYQHSEVGDISFSLVDKLPEVGSSKNWGGFEWQVENLCTYKSTSGSTIAIATCIQPDDSFGGLPDLGKQLLYCFMGRNGEITAEDFDPEDENVHIFGLTPSFKYLPKPGQTPSSSCGWTVESVEEFALVSDRPIGGFDAVYICWCQRTSP
jgi:hypothetical protein